MKTLMLKMLQRTKIMTTITIKIIITTIADIIEAEVVREEEDVEEEIILIITDLKKIILLKRS